MRNACERPQRPSGRVRVLDARQAPDQVVLDLVEGDPLLLHRVALADGDRVVVEWDVVVEHRSNDADRDDDDRLFHAFFAERLFDGGE